MRRALALIGVLSAIALTGHAQEPQNPVAIHGRVVSAETGTPLRNARVQVTVATQTLPPTFTDADGQFVVPRLAAGSPRVSATKAGYVSTTIPVSSAGGAIELRLAKAGAISGRIINSLGDPVIGMTVNAELPPAASAERRVVATGQTDDRGEYRLSGLSAGRFLVSVNDVADVLGPDGALLNGYSNLVAITRDGRTISSNDMRKQVRIYFPGIESIADALPLTLAAGEERAGIDFSAPATPPTDLFGALGARAAPRGGVLSTATGTIRGRVIAADGRAVPQAIVRLESDDAPGLIPGAVTNENGQYEFQRLVPATYTVTATKPGFLTMAYGQRRLSDPRASIELRSAETLDHVDISLPRPGGLGGRVTDENGEPIEGVSVHVVRIQYRDGRRRLVEAGGRGTHRTDDQGAYRIYGLLPGDYFVSASVGQVTVGQPSSERPGYTTTYFPGTSNPVDARQIILDAAQDVADLDFALSRAPTARITGTIVDALGNPVTGGLLLTPSRRSAVLATDAADARIDRTGAFEFPNVSPGESVIQVSKGRTNAYTEGESATQFVTVNGSDVTGLVVRLSRGSTLKGHLTLEGAPYAELYSALNLQAVPIDMDRTPQNLGSPASARIEPNGTFDMAGLSGPRVLRLTEAPRGWMLEAVRLNGRDVTDTPLPFGASDQSIDGVEVVLTDRVPVVAGRVTDARGGGVSGATVVMFSTDRARWDDTSRFLAASSPADRNGMFRVEKLPAGEYYAAAVTSLRSGEWRDPDLLEALIPGATHLTMSEGETTTATLRALTR